jgi:hypothetical protein
MLEVLLVYALVLEVFLKEDEEGRLKVSVVFLPHLLDSLCIVQSIPIAQVLLVRQA